MSAPDELHKLAIEVSGQPYPFVDIQNNDYGWHVIVYDGQMVESEWGARFCPSGVFIMAAGSGSTLDAACAAASDRLCS